MKLSFKKHFLLIGIILTIVYNAVLFLIFSLVDKEAFKTFNFWLIYACMMIAIIAWFIVALLCKTTKMGTLNYLQTVTAPYTAFIFLFTTIMFFVNKKVSYIVILVIFIILTGLYLCLLVVGNLSYKNTETNPAKIITITKVEQLSNYFGEILSFYNGAFQEEIASLQTSCEMLSTDLDNEELVKIDKRLFEYATFINKNAVNNEENNINANIMKFKELLKERNALVAKSC